MAAGPNIFFEASYGNLSLLVAEWSTTEGRDIVVQSPSRGDEHTLSDRGKKHTQATITVLFIDEPGADPYLNRFDAFRALAIAGDPQIFSHALLGSFRARISNFDHRLDADARMVTVTCTVLSEQEPQLVFAPAAGVSSAAGIEAVTSAADSADANLAAAGLVSPVAAAAVTAIAALSAVDLDELDTSAVSAAVTTLANQIQGAIDALDLATDITRWQAYRAMILLAFQVRRAGEAFTTSSSNVIDVTITQLQPLRTVCARVYGPSLADARARQVTRLNRIRTPGLLQPGVYKMPSDGATP